MTVPIERILSIIAAEAGVDQSALRPDATLEELNISSLDVASALFALEDELGVEIDPASITPESTVGELVNRIAALAGK